MPPGADRQRNPRYVKRRMARHVHRDHVHRSSVASGPFKEDACQAEACGAEPHGVGERKWRVRAFSAPSPLDGCSPYPRSRSPSRARSSEPRVPPRQRRISARGRTHYGGRHGTNAPRKPTGDRHLARRRGPFTGPRVAHPSRINVGLGHDRRCHHHRRSGEWSVGSVSARSGAAGSGIEQLGGFFLRPLGAVRRARTVSPTALQASDSARRVFV